MPNNSRRPRRDRHNNLFHLHGRRGRKRCAAISPARSLPGRRTTATSAADARRLIGCCRVPTRF
jgi:hypothetical protein